MFGLGVVVGVAVSYGLHKLNFWTIVDGWVDSDVKPVVVEVKNKVDNKEKD